MAALELYVDVRDQILNVVQSKEAIQVTDENFNHTDAAFTAVKAKLSQTENFEIEDRRSVEIFKAVV